MVTDASSEGGRGELYPDEVEEQVMEGGKQEGNGSSGSESGGAR